MRREEDEYYKKMGDIKAKELLTRSNSVYNIFKGGQRSRKVMGIIKEGIVKEFIKEYLSPGFNVTYGIVYDIERDTHSPEIDAIIYSRSPLMKFGDTAIVEKKQVRMIVEVKSWSGADDIFGAPKKDSAGKIIKNADGKTTRDPNTTYKKIYAERKSFTPIYVLFTFSIGIAEKTKDDEIIQRLNEISDQYVVVSRNHPKNPDLNYDKSVSSFIRTLRTLRD